VVAGRGDAEALAVVLAARVAPLGRIRAREALDAALAPLGDSPEALAIAGELRTMENLYG
jgi:hypothetical protein